MKRPKIRLNDNEEKYHQNNIQYPIKTPSMCNETLPLPQWQWNTQLTGKKSEKKCLGWETLFSGLIMTRALR